MIYEYPKEFIVPVVFAEDLLQKGIESIRYWNLSHNQQELLKNQYEEPDYKYNMALEIVENDNMKTILNDIDEDYAVNQILRI